MAKEIFSALFLFVLVSMAMARTAEMRNGKPLMHQQPHLLPISSKRVDKADNGIGNNGGS